MYTGKYSIYSKDLRAEEEVAAAVLYMTDSSSTTRRLEGEL